MTLDDEVQMVGRTLIEQARAIERALQIISDAQLEILREVNASQMDATTRMMTLFAADKLGRVWRYLALQ